MLVIPYVLVVKNVIISIYVYKYIEYLYSYVLGQGKHIVSLLINL